MYQIKLFQPINFPYSQEELLDLATAPLRYQTVVAELVNFYKYIRSGFYTNEEIKEIANDHDLNLRKTTDRAKLAQIVAAIELEDNYIFEVIDGSLELKAELEESQKQIQSAQMQLEATRRELERTKEQITSVTKALKIVTLARLPQGQPLNIRPYTGLFRVFGSPTSVLQLKHNYRQAIRHLHPDVNDHPEATQRFAYWQGCYGLLLDKFDTKYSVTKKMSVEEEECAMEARSKYPVEYFYESIFGKPNHL